MSWTVDHTHSSVEFAAKHMVIATVKGRFQKYEVDAHIDEISPADSRVEVHIDASSLDTREPQRDAHLRSADFLDVEQFPQIVFKSRRVERNGGDGEYRVTGDLTIRDVTREVVLETTAGLMKDPWGNQRAGITAEAAINRKDFGLNWNVALEAGGWLVGDKVKITIDLELVQQG